MTDNPKPGDATESDANPQYGPSELQEAQPDPSKIGTTEEHLRGLLQVQRGDLDTSDGDPAATQAPIEAVATLDPDTTEQQFVFASEGGGSLPTKDIGGSNTTYIDIRALSRLTVALQLSGTDTTGKVYGLVTESGEEAELASVDTNTASADYGTTYELLDNRDALNLAWVRVTETGAADTMNTITASLLVK